ncbi:TetR/AcrR family transcriptional regulator [Streptomyces albiaxialis]
MASGSSPSPRPFPRRSPSARRRLTARDWAAEALKALGEGGGLAALSVEALATRLGATKGSFYWHFANRDALIEAALVRWEQLGTEAVIADLETEPDPEKRLRTLLLRATEAAAEDSLELSLLAHADHPAVAAVLARVTERRVGYVTALFAELGFTAPEAERRGLLSYSAFLGHAQLGHAVPTSLPTGPARARYLDAVIDTMLKR